MPTAKVIATVVGLLLLLFLTSCESSGRIIKKQFVIIHWNKFGYSDNSVTLGSTHYPAGSRLEVLRYGKTQSGELFVVVMGKSGVEEAYPLKYFTGAYESAGHIITVDWDTEKNRVAENSDDSNFPIFVTAVLLAAFFGITSRHRRQQPRNPLPPIQPRYPPRKPKLHNLPRGF